MEQVGDRVAPETKGYVIQKFCARRGAQPHWGWRNSGECGTAGRAEKSRKEEPSWRRMNSNQTTPHKSTPSPRPWLYTLTPFLLFTLLLCVAAMVAYLRRRSRLDDLRHRLIPLYKYDPAEESGWGDCEEEELTEPLNPDGRLSFISPYGTNTK